MNPKTKTLDALIKAKQKKAQELAEGIENMLINRAQELREYSLTAWVLGQKVREFNQSDGKRSATTACETAADIESFGSLNPDYLDLITSDTHDLINLLHELENLEKAKGEQKND